MTSDGGTDVSKSPLNGKDVLLDGLECFLFFDAAVGEEQSDDTPGSEMFAKTGLCWWMWLDWRIECTMMSPPPGLAPSAEKEAVVDLRRGTLPRRFRTQQSAVDY